MPSPGAKRQTGILRSCVHCGFCTATCPTYQELGDERDGPRGRIYLIKQFLEEGTASAKTQHHLDRCLTCRACETTCPSGVEYGRLADIGPARPGTGAQSPDAGTLNALGAIAGVTLSAAFWGLASIGAVLQGRAAPVPGKENSGAPARCGLATQWRGGEKCWCSLVVPRQRPRRIPMLALRGYSTGSE